MLFTRSLRPARSSDARAYALTTAGVGVAVAVVALAGLTSSSASANVGASQSDWLGSIVATPSPVETARAETVRDISIEAKVTLDGARIAVAEARQISADIAASGLDVGAVASVDTTDLREQIERLSSLDVLPLLLLPDIADDTASETDRVAGRTAALRTKLDAAQAEKAAADAAAQAQREAEAAAAAAAAALAAANTPAGAKAVAQQIASSEYGWGSGQFSCLVSLWNRESGWNYQAYNSGSGATGIPQALPGSKMASAGADWQSNAATQIRWGLSYISRGYGTPCGAWGHSQSTGWY